MCGVTSSWPPSLGLLLPVRSISLISTQQVLVECSWELSLLPAHGDCLGAGETPLGRLRASEVKKRDRRRLGQDTDIREMEPQAGSFGMPRGPDCRERQEQGSWNTEAPAVTNTSGRCELAEK